MTEKHKEVETVLKVFFEAGITPQFAEKPKIADAFKGELNSL